MKVSEERMKLRIDYSRETDIVYSDNIPAYADWLEKKLSQHYVSECVHPLAELVNGDEGLFCCKCQKYVRPDAHIH